MKSVLEKLLSPFTTATSAGVALRYITVIISSALAVAGILGLLSPEQIEALNHQVPELLSAVAGLVAIFMTIYATITKSSSDKAAEAAKQIDAKVPPNVAVEIKTPGNMPDIKIPAVK